MTFFGMTDRFLGPKCPPKCPPFPASCPAEPPPPPLTLTLTPGPAWRRRSPDREPRTGVPFRVRYGGRQTHPPFKTHGKLHAGVGRGSQIKYICILQKVGHTEYCCNVNHLIASPTTARTSGSLLQKILKNSGFLRCKFVRFFFEQNFFVNWNCSRILRDYSRIGSSRIPAHAGEGTHSHALLTHLSASNIRFR